MHRSWVKTFWQGLSLVAIIAIFLTSISQAKAADDCTCKNPDNEEACIEEKKACWESKIASSQQQAQSLSSVIANINGKILVQELEIRKTKIEIETLIREIGQLDQRISGLNVSLDRMTENLIARIGQSYKWTQSNPIELLLVSDSLDEFITSYKYLQIAQKHTTKLMKQAEVQKITFDQEKLLKEKKQAEVNNKQVLLESQQQELNQQKADQQVLLEQTKNDEQRYQKELAKTLAELQAIQSIVAGGGDEEKVRDVNEGDSIASIIGGASPCSNGTHLHFEVVKDGNHQNPSGYLKSIGSIVWNNNPDEAFNFSGDWNWPLSDPARITQGYGMTFYARVRRAYGGQPHTGIDMVSKDGSLTVKAVKNGELYRGSIKCGSGYLRYVKIKHKDSNLESYYLHVNY